MITVSSAFALFLILALASAVFFVSTKTKLPYTVLLTFLGVLLVPLSLFPPLEFLREFSLTPELLFYIFLPTLIFESAYNMSIRRVVDEFKPILLLAIGGYLISAFAIGGALWFIFGLIGLPIPFVVTLLFGALISATDPVAVLSLFKEYGAPRRLSLIFEGESLANDATALALFLVTLGLMSTGFTTTGLALGGVTFVSMLVGGVIFGLVVGGIMVRLIGVFREQEFVAITLMIVLAHITFLLSEIVSDGFSEIGLGFIQFSPIIATTVASLLMGNYGRYKVTPHAEEFVEKFWTQFAFMANSIVFVLVGLLVAPVPWTSDIVAPLVIGVLVVAIARAISTYSVIFPYNMFANASQKIPFAWQHLLAWGSLRGALAVMLVLVIPESLTMPGWSLDISIRDFLLMLTVSSIFTTLFIKAPTIGPIMRKLKITNLTPLEVVSSEEARAMVFGTTLLKLKMYSDKDYIKSSIAARFAHEHEERFKVSCQKCQGAYDAKDAILAERALRLYTIGYEKQVLKELLAFDEVNERVFKKIFGKLTIQGEAIEGGEENPNPSITRDYRDVFENLAQRINFWSKPTERDLVEDSYLYYRAQSILARKVLKEMKRLATEFDSPIFNADMIERLSQVYAKHQKEAIEKADDITEANVEVIEELNETLAARSIFRVENKILEQLQHREMLTPKLFLTLKDEYAKEAHVSYVHTEGEGRV